MEIFFVCEYVFLKQKMYILIHIWLMRAGKKFQPSQFLENKTTFFGLILDIWLNDSLEDILSTWYLTKRYINEENLMRIFNPAKHQWWSFFMKIVFTAWYFFFFVLCEVTKGLFLSSIIIKGSWSQIALYVENFEFWNFTQGIVSSIISDCSLNTKVDNYLVRCKRFRKSIEKHSLLFLLHSQSKESKLGPKFFTQHIAMPRKYYREFCYYIETSQLI